MKKIVLTLCLLTFTFGFSQKKEGKFVKTEAKVTSISYSVNSVKELENIDWKNIKEIFNENKDNVEIKMSFGINLKESESKKVKVSGKFSVEGKSENIDNLIEKSKKGINGLIKIYKKYENK